MAATVVVQNSGGVGGGLSDILKDVSRDERATILKARFAKTIAKAKAIGEKFSDEERRNLERRRRVWLALKRKEEIKKEGELKTKRKEEERETARKALEMEEFDMWIRGYEYDSADGIWKKLKLETCH